MPDADHAAPDAPAARSEQPRHSDLEELEALFDRLQSAYAKLTVVNYTLQAQPAQPPTADTQDPLIEAEHDSRLEEKEIDELHTGEMAGLGAKWEADAGAEEERLVSARAAVLRLMHDLHCLRGQSTRLKRLREEMDRVSSRARRLSDVEARRAALQRRRLRITERQHRLEQRKQQDAVLRADQERLKQKLLTARADQERIIAEKMRLTTQREALIGLLS